MEVSEKKYFCGIDPGKKGCFVVIDEYEKIVDRYNMPLIGKTSVKQEYDLKKLRLIFLKIRSDYPTVVFALEHVAAIPKAGASSSFVFGTGFGLLLGHLNGMHSKYRWELVPPKMWQTGVGTGGSGVWSTYDKMYKKTAKMKVKKVDTKMSSLRCAQRLAPDYDFFRGNKHHDDGAADAFLIAVFMKRKFSGQS
jgi:hypothetical protein